MLTSSAVMSITNDLALSPHDRRSASQPPRRESATSNATRTRPHTVSAETRHTYAQRLADAGVAVDVLKDLMDHNSIDTTMGYYKVTLNRKRQAVEKMRSLVVDHTGTSAPAASATAYEIRSVAVPYGNCIEPSNVKAGGQACPIRFQCAGCGFYRPDPSYLPAIDEHVLSLKATREKALAMAADDFVVRNLNDQINAFDRVRTKMREQLRNMDAEERQQIEEASTVLRKSRASQGLPTTLTITPIEPPRQ
jgi:integrase-like protein